MLCQNFGINCTHINNLNDFVMPNWCSSYLIISGDARSIAKIKMKVDAMKKNVRDENYEIIERGDLLFETLIGLGLAEAGLTRKEYDDGKWYDHNCRRFGTKWDVHNEYYEVLDGNDDNMITMSLTTAWSPPIPFALHLSAKHNFKIRMESEEENYYVTEIANGEIVSFNEYGIEEGTYKVDPDHFWESVVPNTIEYAFEEYDNIDDAVMSIKKTFDFLPKKDMNSVMKELKEYYKENQEAE